MWFFRKEITDSVRGFIFRFLLPLIGGTMLLAMFFVTAFDSIDPSSGSGSSIFGVGTVFVLGMGILLLGAVLMLFTRLRHPAFFRNETLPRTTAEDDEQGEMLTI